LVPVRGRQGSFRYVSATDILNGVADVSVLKDKIVIVGTSAAGLLDLRSTPVQNIYAGVEVHANILSGLLDQTVKSRPTYIIAVEAIELVMLLVLAITLFPHLGVIASALVFLVIVSIVAALNFYVWTTQNLDTHLATPLLLFSLLYGLQLFFGFFFESRKKKQLGNIFGQYIPNELVEEMSKSDDEFSLKGENRVMTVFFSDVRGFTTISEAMENPQDLCDLINEILTPVTQVIHNHKGTIDKYIGDAIMAFWGAPVHTEQHAYLAIKAGLDVIKSLKGINDSFKLKNWPEVDLGIGLNTGAMVVGNMGSQFRIAYTVMGDTVNLGSRLEGLTKQYGVKMIVSESTVEAAPEFAYRELDRVRVKGKNKPITIYEPIAELAEISPEQQTILDLVHQALSDYRHQRWDKSEATFYQLHELKPDDKLSKIYLERIEHYRETPPEDNWDGVFTHTSK
jgi:adenylate cyclase